MDKAPDAYRTISEVADDLDLPQHVLRFWETRFSQIRPLKRGGGRRYYRPEDIDLLKGIRHLLYGEGYTIRGVQRIIKENGVKAIQVLGRGEGGSPLQKPRGPEIIAPGRESHEVSGRNDQPVPIFAEAGYPAPPFVPAVDHEDEAFIAEEDDEPLDLPPAAAVTRPAVPVTAAPLVARPAALPPMRPAPVRIEPQVPVAPPVPVAQTVPVAPSIPAPKAVAPVVMASAPVVAQPFDAMATAPMPSMRPVLPDVPTPPPPAPRLAADDIRRLQAALYELLECRKRLDESFTPR